MESLFFEPEIVDSLYLLHNDFIISTFRKIENTSPPPAVITTLARIYLFPHPRIAYHSEFALFDAIQLDPPSFTHLPSPIFPTYSPHQQYSGLSFLAALTMKLRIVFSEFQQNLPTDPSHLPKYIELIKDDQFIITRSIYFCSCSCEIPLPVLLATPRIEVDSEIIRDFILFVKEALTTILANISNIDTLIASLPSDSSPTTPLVHGIDTQMTDSLKELRDACAVFIGSGWKFFVNLTFEITDPHKSSFKTIILDDPSFTDLILNSLRLPHTEIRSLVLMTFTNIVSHYDWMKEKCLAENLVGRMFDTVDFASLPLSESETLYRLTRFFACLCHPIGNEEEAQFEKYYLIRVSVFDSAKQFITFIFHNSDKLILDEEAQTRLQYSLCWIHRFVKNMELRSDEHDADIVSEHVKWEIRAMVEMENEEHFMIIFQSMLSRTQEWNRNKRERQKRREVLLREEGWDDVFELRVVGIEVNTNQTIQNRAKQFRIEQTLNADDL
ncbi:hypothetical protein BLNAU_11459 [Blattamonas nauphoetae]|uniref:Uncharacterized protein n=1 Tax=Blattamonas nauphoetae TaxID=2049346 RepID=A0ABQ9XQT0_9EUKA|nr:hypothetical protein BLNAU_11459 [Blattamonas nauphoetae]